MRLAINIKILLFVIVIFFLKFKPRYEHADSLTTSLFKEFSDWTFTEAPNSKTKAAFKVVAKDGTTINFNNITKIIRHFLKSSAKVSRTERRFNSLQFETLSFKQNGRPGQVTIGEFIIFSSEFSSQLLNTNTAEYKALKSNLTDAITPFYSNEYSTKYLDSFNWQFSDSDKNIKVSYEISFLLEVIPNDFVQKFDSNILNGGENIKNTNHYVTRRSVKQDIQLPLPPASYWSMLFVSSNLNKGSQYASDSAPESIDIKNKLETFFKSLSLLKSKFDKVDTMTFAAAAEDKLKVSFRGVLYQGTNLPSLNDLFKGILSGSIRMSPEERILNSLHIKPESLEIMDKDNNKPTLTSFFVKFIISSVTYTENLDNTAHADYTALKNGISNALNPYYSNTLKLQSVEMILYTIKNVTNNVQAYFEILHTSGPTVSAADFDKEVLSDGKNIKSTSYNVIRSTVYHNGKYIFFH